jgi:hypothetical protein
MAPRKRFNPIDFYRKAASTKPLSVAAPKTRRTPATTAQLSPVGHLFDKAAPLIADYITAEREKKRSAAARAEMKDVLSAYYNRGGEQAKDVVLNAPMDIDETSEDVDRDAEIAFNKPGGMDAVNAMDPSVSRGAQDMRVALMHDSYRQRQEREAAELKRSQEMEDYIKQQKYKAFAPQGEKRTKEFKNAVSMGLTPGTKEFNDYMRRATKITPDEPNPLLTKHAEALSKTMADWGQKGRAAPGFLAKLGDLRGVLSSGVNQGFGQKFLNNAAALSKRMGWKVNEPNLTGAEVAGSLINQLVVPRVKELGAKPTDKDLQFIVDIFPKIQNQPGSNELILQVLEIDSKRNIARAGFISKWLKENAEKDRYGLDFQANLQAFENSNDIFKKFVPPGWVKSVSSGRKLPPVPAGFTH